jgi:uncharacterized protein (DUF1800 family)
MIKNVSYIHRLAASAAILTILAPGMILRADTKTARKPLTEEQKIFHVLNRLGFGAKPGDVERVRTIGVQKYIEQQLNPASITDNLAESKLRNLDIFDMTTAEIFAKYPNPGALLQAIDRAGNQPGVAGNAVQNPEEMTDKQRQERQAKLREIYQKYDLRPAQQLLPQITANRIIRATYSERQLQEVMVDFWQNHFNVFSGKNAVRWYIPSYERDVLRKNALGNFKDLVTGTAQHPAMLFYLDNFESRSPTAPQPNQNAQRLQQMARNGGQLPAQARERIKQQLGLTDVQLDQRLKEMQANPPAAQQTRNGINENYARELMELHTLGVDGGYKQQDIIEVAKAFTGWTIVDPRGYRRAAAGMINGTEEQRLARIQRQAGIPDDAESGEFYFNQRWHVTGAKTVLGQKVDEGGVKDGMKVIDILVAHPSTAKFIAKKLAVKFVSDNPSNALVSRVAEAFGKSKGDIKTTLGALFSDKEFFAPENYRTKIKSPFELAISSIRALGAETNGGAQMLAMLNKLGEVPYGYQAPTGYPDTAEDWVNTGALLERLNYSIALASNQIAGTRVDLKRFEAKDKNSVMEKAIALVLDNEISAGTRATLLKQVEQPLPSVKAPNEVDDDVVSIPNMREGQQGAQNRQARLLKPSGNPEVFKVVSLVLGTPEFQRQ